MKNKEQNNSYLTTCSTCKGNGKKRQRIRKKTRLNYQRSLEQFEKSDGKGSRPLKPRGHLSICTACNGSGLITAATQNVPDVINYPHVAIIGAGIGGVALAVACLHRGIPFTLFERDGSFMDRSQGYGLTLQQASKAMAGFGINSLENGIVSTKHVVHKIDGTVVGEWGIRKWLENEVTNYSKPTNIHIARQSLRLALLDQLGTHKEVQWSHQLIHYTETSGKPVELTFKVNNIIKTTKADLVVGADGIRSKVRDLLIGESMTPLQYLDCIVILGICAISNLNGLQHDLLDRATVFQTANGYERMYMMPYDEESIMWQFSVPMLEEEATALSKKGFKVLKQETLKRTKDWHTPIPQIIDATLENQISGYPVYDRKVLTPQQLQQSNNITLIGDAAHPMSPFKGQGANQALLDALSLARSIAHGCRPQSNWKENGIRKSVLNDYEIEMLERSGSKVHASAQAAQFLHSNIVLHKGDEPRGRILYRDDH